MGIYQIWQWFRRFCPIICKLIYIKAHKFSVMRLAKSMIAINLANVSGVSLLMSKKLLIGLAVTSLSLVACSKEGDFKKAINVNLSQDPLRV